MYSKHTLETKQQATIVDRREMLRVKLKSLTAESRIIRREEVRTWGPLQLELRAHRVGVVRNEARYSHIAYCLIRGRKFSEIEPIYQERLSDTAFAKIGAMLAKFANRLDTGLAMRWAVMQNREPTPKSTVSRPPKAERPARVRKSRDEYEATLVPKLVPQPKAAWPFDATVGREAA